MPSAIQLLMAAFNARVQEIVRFTSFFKFIVELQDRNVATNSTFADKMSTVNFLLCHFI
jgi:hypothetical protein